MKLIHNKIENFKFRDAQMSELLHRLIEKKQKIVPLVGLYGIGKSALARTTMHYAAERQYFTSGIMIVNLKTCKNTLNVLKLIKEAMLSFLDIRSD